MGNKDHSQKLLVHKDVVLIIYFEVKVPRAGGSVVIMSDL